MQAIVLWKRRTDRLIIWLNALGYGHWPLVSAASLRVCWGVLHVGYERARKLDHACQLATVQALCASE
jgi:hypothetical protein